MKKLIMVICAFCAVSLFAGEVFINGKKYTTRTFKTLDGKVYKDVIIGDVSPDRVDVHYATGKSDKITSIPLKNLPEDLKTELGYSPAKAKKYIEKRAKILKEREAKAKEAAKSNVKIIKDKAYDVKVIPKGNNRINKYSAKELNEAQKEIDKINKENKAKGKRTIMPNDVKRKIELIEKKKKKRKMREELKKATQLPQK